MTKKEFKAAMLRGLGRCVRAVEREPEKYRDLVLWACGRDIAYDTQCEGSRSWYVYTMAKAYPDTEPFVQAAEKALRKYRPNWSWDLLHLSELLLFFAQDGYASAWQALEEKYREIYAAMLARKRRPPLVFDELADLERLGLVLTTDRWAFLRIAGDFGRLYREKRYMLDGDFAWYFAVKGKKYRKTMENAAKKDENIACFMQREQAADARFKEPQKETPPESLKGVPLSRWLDINGDTETKARYAALYREEQEPVARAEALKAFFLCPYPEEPTPLIADTESACDELRFVAWRALSQIRHPAVRAFALSNIANGIRTPENFALLTANAMPEDEDFVEALLREKITAEDPDDRHWAGMTVLDAVDKDGGMKHLLPLLYEHTPCSCCRESVLRSMAEHQMLTEEILEECLNDSSDDIRRFAEKRLKR
ncbi:MAG: hypothetical protein E7464_08095 [Ruminococcaceae bacterium]|nr:hypothetical protein [Oscillospiraceae bacterium]